MGVILFEPVRFAQIETDESVFPKNGFKPKGFYEGRLHHFLNYDSKLEDVAPIDEDLGTLCEIANDSLDQLFLGKKFKTLYDEKVLEEDEVEHRDTIIFLDSKSQRFLDKYRNPFYIDVDISLLPHALNLTRQLGRLYKGRHKEQALELTKEYSTGLSNSTFNIVDKKSFVKSNYIEAISNETFARIEQDKHSYNPVLKSGMAYPTYKEKKGVINIVAPCHAEFNYKEKQTSQWLPTARVSDEAIMDLLD